ncbi:hypothetical protein [Mesorhizobium sp. LSHC412B00]|uniref:hypothetical protein n=1 Tax=Mesorhizobium sp. LSHC412B00 TaxID=1287285 RepID=UPI0003CEC5C0|nr:hypothetical protein [Mesorhizobium sp. LSHC412B00]ESX87179.1 hypothetical protein X756_14155 [Mesorhizobium sp. LSHC412B00]
MALVKLGKLNEDGALVHERDAGSALKASEVMMAQGSGAHLPQVPDLNLMK